MADRSSQLLLQALRRAATDGSGTPLHGSRSQPGLFPGTPLGKQAAQRAREDGLLSALADERYILTDKGRAHLVEEANPRQVLEDLVRVLEARDRQVEQLLDQARGLRDQMRTLADHGRAVLATVAPASESGELNQRFQQFHAPAPVDGLLARLLEEWAGQDDCPLPELFRRAAAHCPGLSLGAFHDALRRLREAGRLHLHPWTAPLHEMPEPPCALLVGHEVAYYASVRE